MEDRDGSDRHRHRPDRGGDAIGRALSRGGSCVGISPTPQRHLPTSLTGAADLWVTVAARDETISATILAATGRRPRNLPPGAAIGLDPDDIAAAIRAGEPAARAVERLRVAARARTVVDSGVAEAPPLQLAAWLRRGEDLG